MNCGTETCGPAPAFAPRVDAWETPRGYELRLEVPGVAADGLEVHAEHGQLHVAGRVAPRAAAGTALATEYGVGDFRRSFQLGEDVAAEGIAATLKDGVLALHLPKKPEVQPRRVAVTTG